MSETVIIPTNEFQTPITREWLERYPSDVQEQFMDYMDTVPLLKYMVGPRKRASELARDERGRIIVDITHPHILTDMDYFRPMAKFFQENGCYTFLRPNSNPNSEFGKLLAEEVRRCRDGYVRESDGEWVPGQLYWFLNYCPIMLNREVEHSGMFVRVQDFPDFWEGIYYRFHYLDQARHIGKHGLELARRGCAKAHPYDETVITPNGTKRWGDINIGDTLFGDDGFVTTVTDIPFDGLCDTYKITLKDGRTVFASDQHLWRVKIHNHKHEEVLSTVELQKIYKRNRKVSDRNPSGVEYICGVPANKSIEFAYSETQVDPYTFGVMLGDGCFSAPSCTLSENDEDMKEIERHIPYKCTKRKNSCDYGIAIPNWHSILRSYGLDNALSSEKFIPDEYKYNSSSVRLGLLKGLMDSDGYVGKRDIYTISTTSEKLAKDIRWLCWSLGYNNTMTSQKAGYRKDGIYKQCKNTYIISIHTTERITNLPRKVRGNWHSNYAKSHAIQSRIVNIEYIGKRQSKCVTVDNKSHCYLIGDFIVTHNSFSLAGIMSHNLILGENLYAKERVTTVLTAYLKEYLSQKDGTFSKFTPIIDHIAATTEFPRLMLTRRSADLLWVMGYKNANGNERGSRNAVMGLSVKDDEGKIRGKRGTILFEEIGSYPNFKEVWNNVRDSVKEGSRVFSQLYGVGTAGDDESDFSGVRTMLYNPDAYEIYALDNVYDKLGKGATKFAYFFPSYISRAGCMDKDGNSDVVKALMEILMERYMVQKGGDAASLLSRIAQMPITPEEAILKVRSNFFPTLMLNERIRQIDTDPHFYDDVYIGELIENKDGKVEFHANNDIPIRKYPADALEPGALEIYSMPPSDNIPMNRYVIGVDPVDNDKAESESLMSALVFDLFNDEIVAEYTGRKQYARDGYEVVRLLAVFYNAQVMYESNRKLMFSHFQAKKCLWMLADCPDWIKSKGLIKYDLFGSNKKGVSVNGPLISTGIELINDWLKKTRPVTVKDERGESHIEDVPIVYGIRNRALLEELVSYGPGKNTDRVSALFQVMFYREQFTILYGENGSGIDDEPELTDDPFFNKDWDRYQARIGESYKSAFGL